jgi:hypothetical protein
MKPGDVVEVEIDGGIGVLRNPIIAESCFRALESVSGSPTPERPTAN